MPVGDYEKLIQEQSIEEKKEVEFSEDLLNNFDAIWASDSRTGAVIKSVAVPFAILEYANSEIDLLRMNECYTREFGSKGLERCLLHHEYYKLLTAAEEAVLSKDAEECECLFIMPDGSSRWYQIRMNYIGTVGKISLVSATFANVSAERMLETELNAVFSALRDRPGRRDSLLVIDDLEISRAVLRSIFEDEYQIISASDGKEGLDLLKEHNKEIAAILLDMIMPNMDGREFLSYKNKMPEAAEIPVIVISAENNESTQLNMLENGVNDYVTKPFVPALVKRRLKNVIEYNSRFKNLVHEYQEVNSVKTPAKLNLDLTGYTIDQVRYVIKFMSKIFDLVRLVDPQSTAVITIQPNGTIKRDPYSCFGVWGKTVRCENCSSMCALNGKCAINKFELLENDVFYVVSQPVSIYTSDNVTENLVLEIASSISDKEQPNIEKKQDFFKLLENSQKIIYTDPLTMAYNRRFLDEMIFLHHGQNGVAKKVAFIMLDLNDFKQINDLFGHQAGDRVLKGAVSALKKQIRQNDSVIRYGGDEFIIVLTNCEESLINVSIERFKKAVEEVKYGPKGTMSLQAAFGHAYTSEFDQDSNMLAEMVKKADKMMYENKREMKQNGRNSR
jgi:diguanylate cyclase (GGDEF)-like protein